jgi:shikimate kinase
MNLYLIGYRCTGKTTIGKAIAAAIDWSFVDADTKLVSECGKPIKEIVDTDGWETFRRMEGSILKQICTKDRQIVATGGGVVLDKANIKAMKTSGMVIWLGAAAETIQKRMLQDKNTGNFRPALTEKGRMEEIEDMLLKRNPYYESASDFSIQTDDVPLNEISAIIIQRIKDKIGE